MSLRSIVRYTLVFSVLISAIENVLAQTLDVLFRITSPDANYRNSTITMIKNKKRSLTFSPQKKRMKIQLDYNADYLLKFEMAGCGTKEIHINTRKVPNHMKYELLEIAFEVELSKESRSEPGPYRNSSFIKWYYHTDDGDFTYLISNHPISSSDADVLTETSDFPNKNNP